MVADVAQVRSRAELEALEPDDRLARGLELVALGGDEPVELVHALLEAVAAAQVLAPRAVEDLALERVHAFLDRRDHGVVRVGERVEDAVDQ